MRTIVMRDEELIYAITGLVSSFRWLDEYRVAWAGKSVNNVTEQALRQRLGALEQMCSALGDDFMDTQDMVMDLHICLRKSHEKTPWETPLPRQLEQAVI